MKYPMLLLLILGTGTAVGQQKTNTLYNLATSGLYLRSQPKNTARVITKVPYSAQVQVLDTTETVSTLGWMTDHWLKVHFRGRTGYLYAGYLSTVGAPEKTVTTGKLTMALEDYVEFAFKADGPPVHTHENGVHHTYQPLKNRAFLETEVQNGSSSASLTFSANDVFDAYVILEALLYWNNRTDLMNTLRFIKDKDGRISRITDAQGRFRISELSKGQIHLNINDIDSGP